MGAYFRPMAVAVTRLMLLGAASIATGWSEPVPGREFHPLKSSAFHGALFRQTTSTPDGIITPVVSIRSSTDARNL